MRSYKPSLKFYLHLPHFAQTEAWIVKWIIRTHEVARFSGVPRKVPVRKTYNRVTCSHRATRAENWFPFNPNSWISFRSHAPESHSFPMEFQFLRSMARCRIVSRTSFHKVIGDTRRFLDFLILPCRMFTRGNSSLEIKLFQSPLLIRCNLSICVAVSLVKYCYYRFTINIDTEKYYASIDRWILY